MADLSITAANVTKGAGAQVGNGVAGATIATGQPLYEDGSANNTLKPADANASQAAARVKGIALHPSLAGQPIAYQYGGDLNVGAILTVGELYVLSATVGDICPASDGASGMYTTVLGFGKTTSVLSLDIINADVARA